MKVHHTHGIGSRPEDLVDKGKELELLARRHLPIGGKLGRDDLAYEAADIIPEFSLLQFLEGISTAGTGMNPAVDGLLTGGHGEEIGGGEPRCRGWRVDARLETLAAAWTTKFPDH